MFFNPQDGSVRAYKLNEAPQRPVINQPPKLSFPPFIMPYGSNYSFTLGDYRHELEISDPDGDTIQQYKIQVDPAQIDMEAPNTVGQPRGSFLMLADQLNDVRFYGTTVGTYPVQISAFDGKTWSDPHTFNLTVNPAATSTTIGTGSSTGGGSTGGNGGNSGNSGAIGKGGTTRTGGSGLSSQWESLKNQVSDLEQEKNQAKAEVDKWIKALEEDNNAIDGAIPNLQMQISNLEGQWWNPFKDNELNKLRQQLEYANGQKKFNNQEIDRLNKQWETKKTSINSQIQNAKEGLKKFEEDKKYYIELANRNWSEAKWEEAINDYYDDIEPKLNRSIGESTDPALRKLYEDLSVALVGKYYLASGGYIADSYYNATGRELGYHGAIDIGAGYGIVVKSLVKGTLVLPSTSGLYGDVAIRTDDGKHYLYRHLEIRDRSLVTGEINPDQPIPGVVVSSTGMTNPYDYHLHYEVVKPEKDAMGELADRTGSTPEERKQKIRDQTRNPLQDYWEKMWLGK